MENEYDVPSSGKSLKQIWEDEKLSEKAGALVSGLFNAPMDMAKYIQLGKNRLDLFAGYQNAKAADIKAQEIADFWANPPFLPETVNAYRAYLSGTHPELTFAGEVAAGGLGGLGLAKPVLNLAKTGKQLNFVNRLTGQTLDSRGKFAGIGAGGAALGELAAEPLYDQYFLEELQSGK